jgi:L-lactate dehydrogenase complex protein LldG
MEEGTPMTSRDAVLARLRAAPHDAPGPVAPYRPQQGPDRVEQFMGRAVACLATVQRLSSLDALPAAAASYLEGLNLPRHAALAEDLGGLDWAGWTRLPPPGREPSPVSIGTVGAAIAETGSIILTSRDAHGPWPNLLADTHIAVVPAGAIVATVEEAVGVLRGNRLPRSLHLATGPSRTGDIEQTLELGAHGAVRLHIVIVDGDAQ